MPLGTLSWSNLHRYLPSGCTWHQPSPENRSFWERTGRHSSLQLMYIIFYRQAPTVHSYRYLPNSYVLLPISVTYVELPCTSLKHAPSPLVQTAPGNLSSRDFWTGILHLQPHLWLGNVVQYSIKQTNVLLPSYWNPPLQKILHSCSEMYYSAFPQKFTNPFELLCYHICYVRKWRSRFQIQYHWRLT